MNNEIKQFEVGKAYHLGYLFGDTTLVREIVKRTAKTVTVIDYDGSLKTCRVKIVNGVEWFYPFGRYSMAPAIDADHLYLGVETERKLDPLWDWDHRERQEPALAR